MIYHRFTILSIPAVNCTVGNTKERLNKEEPYRMLDDLIWNIITSSNLILCHPVLKWGKVETVVMVFLILLYWGTDLCGTEITPRQINALNSYLENSIGNPTRHVLLIICLHRHLSHTTNISGYQCTLQLKVVNFASNYASKVLID